MYENHNEHSLKNSSSLPEYFGAKSRMLDLLPDTVTPVNPTEMANIARAACVLHPIYPANTKVTAGT